VLACEDCEHSQIAYNSCRNRHCPKCQGAAARDWLAEREAELLPVGYFHLVFTLPKPIAEIAYQNKAVIYDILFKASAETVLTIAATPRHLGAKIGFTSVLHTWGSAMTHHPHIHMIVPGGGISPDGTTWIRARPNFLLSVHVLSRLFRRRFLEMLLAAHQDGRLKFFGDHAGLVDSCAFETFLAPLHESEWVVHAQPSFGGPQAVLSYLARYTHRVAISNSRIRRVENGAVTFTCKDYRRDGAARYGTMTLEVDEFIRRFLCTSCPRASTASDTTVSSPTAIAPPTSGAPVNCSAHRRLSTLTRIPSRQMSNATASGPVPVAAEVFEPGCRPKYQPSPEAIDSS
jgi:hypothetical protein